MQCNTNECSFRHDTHAHMAALKSPAYKHIHVHTNADNTCGLTAENHLLLTVVMFVVVAIVRSCKHNE